VTPTTSINRPDALRVGIAYLSFIIIAMPGVPALGVAWDPAIRETFGLPLDAVGVLLAVTMGTYFIFSFISGRLVTRFGIGPLLTAASAITCIGVIGYVVAPAWPVMVICGVLVGAGAALIDCGMNIYFAANYGPRLMNWLHAAFGVGAALSPLMMTAILNNGNVWRLGYVVIAALFGLLVILFGLTRGLWKSSQLPTTADNQRSSITPRDTLRLPLVWLGISFFFLYGGQETVPGQWSFSLFTESRQVAAETAGLWVSIYWFCFTIGRVIFGLMVSWMKARTLLNLCVIGIIIGSILMWWNPAGASPSTTLAFIGLGLFGFTIGPMFALIITSTQERLGPYHAPNAIGFQVAAASIGGGLMPGLAGRLAVDQGIEIVPVFLVIITFIAVGLYLLSTRSALSVQPQPAPAGD
jgi:fucose permease